MRYHCVQNKCQLGSPDMHKIVAASVAIIIVVNSFAGWQCDSAGAGFLRGKARRFPFLKDILD